MQNKCTLGNADKGNISSREFFTNLLIVMSQLHLRVLPLQSLTYQPPQFDYHLKTPNQKKKWFCNIFFFLSLPTP